MKIDQDTVAVLRTRLNAADKQDRLLLSMSLLEARALLRIAEQAGRLDALINSPETVDFQRGVRLETTHQVERWGRDHDANKSPFDWFAVACHLAHKAMMAMQDGNIEKARHHCVSTAALMANWHRRLE